jgi:hypothetical protein
LVALKITYGSDNVASSLQYRHIILRKANDRIAVTDLFLMIAAYHWVVVAVSEAILSWKKNGQISTASGTIGVRQVLH